MNLSIEVQADIAFVTCSEGTLGGGDAGSFRKQFLNLVDGYRKIVVDIGALNFVDSPGLGMLVACMREVDSRGGLMKLCKMNKSVARMFEAARMDRLFEIHASRREAAKSFHEQEQEDPALA
jgi:anti-sigma B factor antagonist